MAETGGQGWVVLHVGCAANADSGKVSHPVGQFLSSCTAGVEHCGDVYRGLARLCRSRASLPEAVVVCADTLGTPELEFFSVVSRLFRRLPVYVYGGGRSRARMARAIQLGAAGEADEVTIRSLFELKDVRVIESTREASVAPAASPAVDAPELDEAEVAGAAADEAEVREADAAKDELVEGDYEPGRVVTEEESEAAELEEEAPFDEEGVEEEPVEEGPAEDVGTQEPVRVPWLTYSDRPARQAPLNGGPRESEADREERRVRPRIAERPLLTDEELEALIGDLDALGGDAAEDEES